MIGEIKKPVITKQKFSYHASKAICINRDEDLQKE